MAAGDIIIPDNTITPELLDKIAAEVQNRILSTSKDPGQYEEVDSLTGVTSIPVFQQSGSTYKLVRVLLSILKGVDGKEVHLQSTETHLQWRWTDGMWNNLIALADLKGDPGDTPIFRTGSSGIEWKYVSEDETGWKVLVTFEVLKLKFIDLTAEQIAAFWQAIPEDVLILFQKPATDAAAEVREQMAQISQNVSQAITETNTAKQGAIEATVNAKSVSDHPGYIGSDYHVYTWDYVTGAYIKTDVVLRPEGFSIYRSYPSIAKMNEDLANVPEGKFVLINTNDVEQGDNAKMYVRGAISFEYLVDMSGAIGFTGKTPQFSIGLVSKGETPSATISEDGIDVGGNPKYKLNLVLPKGDPGTDGKTPVFEIDSVTTGEPGTNVSVILTPNGQTAEGNPIYKLSITIPRGQQGLPGEGSGNVSADGTGLILGKKYLFVPNADGSTSGSFVEYVPHTSYMLVFGANKAIPADAFTQISNAFNTGGEVLVKFTNGSVYKPGSIDIQDNVATLKMFNFGNDYITIEVTDGVTTAEIYSNKVVIDSDIAKKIEAHNISSDAHQDIRLKLKESVLDAPIDGKPYNRKDGAWVESSGDNIKIPSAILDLTSSSTSDEIKAALGGDEGFEYIYEGAKNGVCFIDVGVASGGQVNGGYICQLYQSGIDAGMKVIAIFANLSPVGGDMLSLMIAKNGDVYVAEVTIEAEGYTGWVDKFFYMNSVIHLRSDRFSTGMSSEEINTVLKLSDGLGEYLEIEGDASSSAFEILYYFHQAYSVPILYTLYIDDNVYNITYFPKVTTYNLSTDVNTHYKIDLSVTHDDIEYILSIERHPDGTLSCVKEERPIVVDIPSATPTALGGMKTGYTTSGKNYPVKLDGSSNAYVNVPWTDTNTTYSLATTIANGLLRQLTGSTSTFMRADGTWATPPNTTYNAATTSTTGLMAAADKKKMDRLRSYTTSSTVASLNVNYETIYVTLNANASLSANLTGTAYNGYSITAYVYTASARTITIPTSGSYVSMCGSSFTTTAGKWVEFNLTCVGGKWHIAKIEQE